MRNANLKSIWIAAPVSLLLLSGCAGSGDSSASKPRNDTVVAESVNPAGPATIVSQAKSVGPDWAAAQSQSEQYAHDEAMQKLKDAKEKQALDRAHESALQAAEAGQTKDAKYLDFAGLVISMEAMKSMMNPSRCRGDSLVDKTVNGVNEIFGAAKKHVNASKPEPAAPAAAAKEPAKAAPIPGAMPVEFPKEQKA